MKTKEELELELQETNAKLAAAEQTIASQNQDAEISRIAEEQAGKAVAQIEGFTQDFNSQVAEQIERKVKSMLPGGLATALSGIVVSPKISMPADLLRHGNLSKSHRQFLDAAMGRKVMTAIGGSAGDEWVPQDLASDLIRMVDIESRLRGFVRVIDMPTNPYNLPGITAHMTMEYQAENTTATASNPTTAATVLTAKKLIGKIQFSEELVEDSIIPVIPALMEDCATAAAQAEESVVLWGDDTTTAASNIDKNVGAGTSAQQAFNGLWYTIKNGTADWFISYGTDWPTSIRAMRSAMAKYAINPLDCLVIMSADVFNHVVGSSGFLTWDKVGAQASTLTGLLPNPTAAAPYGMFDGMWVTLSAFMYNTDANGIRLTTAASNSKHTVALVNRKRVIIGQRRQITIKPWYDPLTDSNYLVVTTRIALGLPDGGTTGAYAGIKNG